MKNLSKIMVAMFVLVVVSGCGGSLRREYQSDFGSSVADPLYSHVDTRGATALRREERNLRARDCLALINDARTASIDAYCRMTGGCSNEGATTESETTVRLSMREFCGSPAGASTELCRQMANTPLDQLPTLESTTRTPIRAPSTRTTGIDSGLAFFYATPNAEQYAAFCQNAAAALEGDAASADPRLWQLASFGMPFNQATQFTGGGLPYGGIGGPGFAPGLGNRPTQRIVLDARGMSRDVVAVVSVMGVPSRRNGAVGPSPGQFEVRTGRQQIVPVVTDFDYQVEITCVGPGGPRDPVTVNRCFSDQDCPRVAVELDVICGRN